MGILSKIFGGRRAAPPPLHHPRLGELRWQEEGWWEGACSVDSETSLEFAVSGDREGPSDTLVSALEATLGRWREVNQRLQHFLGSQVPDWAASAADSPRPISLTYLWPAKPDCFAIELALEGDEEAIWRVEFERGEPKHLSRDD